MKYTSLKLLLISDKTKKIFFTSECEYISWLQDIKTAIFTIKLKTSRKNEFNEELLKHRATEINVCLLKQAFFFLLFCVCIKVPLVDFIELDGYNGTLELNFLKKTMLSFTDNISNQICYRFRVTF